MNAQVLKEMPCLFSRVMDEKFCRQSHRGERQTSARLYLPLPSSLGFLIDSTRTSAHSKLYIYSALLPSML